MFSIDTTARAALGLGAAVGVLLLFPCAGCRSASEPVLRLEYGQPVVASAELGTMYNVSVSGDLWLGSFPGPADLDLAARRGIAAAIDLSTPGERPGYDVAATCVSHAIEYVPIGIENRERITDDDVDRALAALRTHAGHPALLFCAHGDRAAMFFAIHRAAGGIAIEQALVEARRAGMKPGHPEVFVRRQVERIATDAAARHGDVAADRGDDLAPAIAMR